MRRISAVTLALSVMLAWCTAPANAYYTWGGFPFTDYAGSNPGRILMGLPSTVSSYSYYRYPYNRYWYNGYNSYLWPAYVGGGLLLGTVGYGLYRGIANSHSQDYGYDQATTRQYSSRTYSPAVVDQIVYGQYLPQSQATPQTVAYQQYTYYPAASPQVLQPGTVSPQVQPFGTAGSAQSSPQAQQFEMAGVPPSLSPSTQAGTPPFAPPVSNTLASAPLPAPQFVAGAATGTPAQIGEPLKTNPLAAGFVDTVNGSYGGDLAKALENSAVWDWARAIGLVKGSKNQAAKLSPEQINKIRNLLDDPFIEASSKLEKVRVVMSGSYL